MGSNVIRIPEIGGGGGITPAEQAKIDNLPDNTIAELQFSRATTEITVYNDTGVGLNKGVVVYPDGLHSGVPTISLADSSYWEKSRLVGFIKESILPGTTGTVTKFGLVSGLNTSAYAADDIIFLSDTPGQFTATRPTDKQFTVVLGKISSIDVSDGSLVSDIQVTNIADEVTDTNGFPSTERANTTLSVVTGTRTFTITNDTANYRFYQKGIQYHHDTPQSVVFNDTEGFVWFYFDDGVLKAETNPSPFFETRLILDYCLVGAFYWDATNKEVVFDILDERHGIGMSPNIHLYEHVYEGARYTSGLKLTDITPDENGNDNSDAQLGVSQGQISDEDLPHFISEIVKGSTIDVGYLTGTGQVRFDTQTNFSVLNAPSGRLYYNKFDNGTWTNEEVTNRDFVLYHFYAYNGDNKNIMATMGQNIYLNKGAAREGAASEILNIKSLLNLAESVPLGTVIFQTSNSYGNDVKARIVSTDEGADYVDWTESELVGGHGTSSSHINLTDKDAADQHPIGAITDLTTTLADKPSLTASGLQTFTNAQINFNQDIQVLGGSWLRGTTMFGLTAANRVINAGTVEIQNGLKDNSNSLGTNGQVLTTNGVDEVNWETPGGGGGTVQNANLGVRAANQGTVAPNTQPGANSVDFTTGRTNGNYVVSGEYSGALSGYGQIITGDKSVVAGGLGHAASGEYGFIGGGNTHSINSDCQYGFIGGGYKHTMYSNSDRATIVGGYDHTINAGAKSFIGGGQSNDIVSSTESNILGGYGHTITSSNRASIVGGANHNITGAENGFVSGGWKNTADNPAEQVVSGYNSTSLKKRQSSRFTLQTTTNGLVGATVLATLDGTNSIEFPADCGALLTVDVQGYTTSGYRFGKKVMVHVDRYNTNNVNVRDSAELYSDSGNMTGGEITFVPNGTKLDIKITTLSGVGDGNWQINVDAVINQI